MQKVTNRNPSKASNLFDLHFSSRFFEKSVVRTRLWIYVYFTIFIYTYTSYMSYVLYVSYIYTFHMYMTIWLSPFFKNKMPYQTSSSLLPESSWSIFFWISFLGLKPEDRVLKRVVWNFLHRLSAPTPLSGDVAGNLDAPGPVVGPWRSTWRLVRRIFGVEQRLQNRAEMWLEWWLLWKKHGWTNGEDGWEDEGVAWYLLIYHDFWY